MEGVLADIDTDYGYCVVEIVGHSVLLVFGAPCQLRSLTGQEHGRTIPLADIGSRRPNAEGFATISPILCSRFSGDVPQYDLFSYGTEQNQLHSFI